MATPPPAFPLPSSAVPVLLAACLLLPACSPVDPDEALRGLTDRCVNASSCAPGFVCDLGHCAVPVGSACREGFRSQSCELTRGVCADTQRPCARGVVADSCSIAQYGSDYEPRETRCDGLDNDCDGHADAAPCALTQGVCAGTRRTCVDGVLEQACTAANYGPRYEPRERRCDGLDNDCNGVVDAANPESLWLSDTPGPIATKVIPFGEGFLAVTVSRHFLATPGGAQRPVAGLYFQALDASLQPAGEQVKLHELESELVDWQVLPYASGAFVLWTNEVEALVEGQVQRLRQPRIARLDVGADPDAPVVGLAPRSAPIAKEASLVRGAVSGNAQHLLLAWHTDAVRGQRFSLALEPQTSELPLGALPPSGAPGFALSLFDVAADGPSGFAAAWVHGPVTSGAAPSAASAHVGFRRLSSELQPVAEPAPWLTPPGFVVALHLVGSPREGVAPFAAWIVSPTPPGSPTPFNPAAVLHHAWPFAPGAVPEAVSSVDTHLELGRDAEDVPLVAFLRPFAGPRVRRVAAPGAAWERLVSPFSSSGAPTLSLLQGEAPGLLRLVVSAQGQQPTHVTACHP